jgi:hypothetical protein
MQYILLSLLMTAVQIPGATFQTARKILVDAGYRTEVIKTIDPHTRSFWEDEWESFGKKEKAFFSGVSHLIYVVVAGCVGERWTVQPRYFTA